MQAAPASMRASPRQAPGGDTDRLAAKAITTPPMANTRPTLLRKVRGLDPEKGGNQHCDQGRGRECKSAPCGCCVDQGCIEQDGEEDEKEQAEANPSRPVALPRPTLAFEESEREKQHRAAPKRKIPMVIGSAAPARKRVATMAVPPRAVERMAARTPDIRSPRDRTEGHNAFSTPHELTVSVPAFGAVVPRGPFQDVGLQSVFRGGTETGRAMADCLHW